MMLSEDEVEGLKDACVLALERIYGTMYSRDELRSGISVMGRPGSCQIRLMGEDGPEVGFQIEYLRRLMASGSGHVVFAIWRHARQVLPVRTATSIEEVFSVLRRERQYQDVKWGPIADNPHSIGEWLSIAAEELSEAQGAFCAGYMGHTMNEMVQVAAVLVAALEQHGLGDWRR